MHLPFTGLYTFADTTYCPHLTHAQLAEELLKGGAKIIQLRIKNKPAFETVRIAKDIMALKNKNSFTFIINDDPKICAEVNADGVHLGQEDMHVSEARKIVGPDKIVGLSTHSLEQARCAQNENINYIGLGGIFPTSSKPEGHPVLGTTILAEVVKQSRLPVVAIGGIDRTNAEEVLKTKVSCISMISALTKSLDIVREVQYYVGLFRTSTHA